LELDQVRQIREHFIQEHMTADSGIVAVSVSLDELQQPCLVVTIFDESSNGNIPSRYKDVTVMIRIQADPLLDVGDYNVDFSSPDS
jgi:hypothetical protein